MSPVRLRMRFATMAGSLLAAAAALAVTTNDDPVEAAIKAIEDRTRPDEQRAAARNAIVLAMTRGDKAAAERLLARAEKAADDNVRMHFAIVLAHTRDQRDKEDRLVKVPALPQEFIPQAVELLAKWLAAKDGDSALRLWAALGIANSRGERAIALLKELVLAPDGNVVLRAAVARALGEWRGDRLVKEAMPILVALLGDKSPEVRVAACDALRITQLNRRVAVDPLFKVAREDPDEAAWRAAVAALRALGGGNLQISPGGDDAERKQKLDAWYKVWAARQPRETEAPKEE